VTTYKTLRPGTRISGGTYKVPKFLGNKIIHPYSDFLLHDVGTGDGIPQAAKPEYLDQSTANKFRTAPLWGLRFRQGLMHDGDSPGTEAAGSDVSKIPIAYGPIRHVGEQSECLVTKLATRPATILDCRRFCVGQSI
jgi:Di-haem oxidoreductase, putative peroxidase